MSKQIAASPTSLVALISTWEREQHDLGHGADASAYLRCHDYPCEFVRDLLEQAWARGQASTEAADFANASLGLEVAIKADPNDYREAFARYVAARDAYREARGDDG